ncbi:hypothetical protein GQ42DRAFT_162920 [Ramicandelaber brevisporus]|nr:hypothetical protein GQ42DRAFT_162920 [Ramicandelaber brevisporus]
MGTPIAIRKRNEAFAQNIHKRGLAKEARLAKEAKEAERKKLEQELGPEALRAQERENATLAMKPAAKINPAVAIGILVLLVGSLFFQVLQGYLL